MTIQKTETLITTGIQDNQHNLKSGVAFMAKRNKIWSLRCNNTK